MNNAAKAEGVIKYDQSNFTFIPALPEYEYKTVESYRKKLHAVRLIGVYENGLGFGNISQRKNYGHIWSTKQSQFIISGTQTGHLKDLTGEHYVRVIDFDIERFSVMAQGTVRASSETVTHASIYSMNPHIQAIIHFHHPLLWKHMQAHDYASTGKWVLYGTQEMALAVKACVGTSSQGIFVMKGHEDGGVAYGPNLNTAMNIIAQTFKRFIEPTFRID